MALPVESHRRVSSVLLQAPRWRLWWIWFCFPCAHVAFATTTATLSPQTAPSLPSGGGQISEEVQAGSPPPWLRGRAQYALSAPLEILFFLTVRLAPSPELGILGVPRQTPSQVTVLGGSRGAKVQWGQPGACSGCGQGTSHPAGLFSCLYSTLPTPTPPRGS